MYVFVIIKSSSTFEVELSQIFLYILTGPNNLPLDLS